MFCVLNDLKITNYLPVKMYRCEVILKFSELRRNVEIMG